MNELVTIYGFCAFGVAISVLLPVLRRLIPQSEGSVAGVSTFIPRIWNVSKPYLALGLFSLLVAALIVAFMQNQLTDWRAALLAGYAADSTLQKLNNK